MFSIASTYFLSLFFSLFQFSHFFLPFSTFIFFFSISSFSLAFSMFLSFFLSHSSPFLVSLQNSEHTSEEATTQRSNWCTCYSQLSDQLTIKKNDIRSGYEAHLKTKTFFSQHKIQNGRHFVHGQFTEHSSVRLVATRPKRNYAPHRSVGLPAVGQSWRRTGRRQRNVEGSKSERPSGINITFLLKYLILV